VRIEEDNEHNILSYSNFKNNFFSLKQQDWVGFKLTTLVVISTDSTGSCKSNYHKITTTMAPYELNDQSKLIPEKHSPKWIIYVRFVYLHPTVHYNQYF
jgi:hypothetical protein